LIFILCKLVILYFNLKFQKSMSLVDSQTELRNQQRELLYPGPPNGTYGNPQTIKTVTIPVAAELGDYIDTIAGDGFAKDTDLATTNSKLNGFFPFASVTGSCANDAAAQSAGVPVGGLYHTSGTIKVRLV
jgi:hypothetical protein